MKTHVRVEEIKFAKVRRFWRNCVFARVKGGNKEILLHFSALCQIGTAHNGIVFSNGGVRQINPHDWVVFVPTQMEHWLWGLKEEYAAAVSIIAAQRSPAVSAVVDAASAMASNTEQMGKEIIGEIECGDGRRVAAFRRRYPSWGTELSPRVSAVS